jgi:hypothetical protein
MTSIDPAQVGMTAFSDVVIVKNTSRQREIMKISHKRISEAFTPAIASVEGRTYCECPGFLDNRGAEINIANIVNTRRALLASKSTRLVVLINYHSLVADSAYGLRRIIKIAIQLFGNLAIFKAHKDSFLVGITHVPELTKRRAKVRPLQHLKAWISLTKVDGVDECEEEVFKAFAERLFIYHPLDAVDQLVYSGGVTKESLLRVIDEMPIIKNPPNVFRIPLQAEDEKGLREICEGMEAKILSKLQQKEYRGVNTLLDSLDLIKQIDHSLVETLVNNCRKAIVLHLIETKEQIDQALNEDELIQARSTFYEKAEALRKAEERDKTLLLESGTKTMHAHATDEESGEPLVRESDYQEPHWPQSDVIDESVARNYALQGEEREQERLPNESVDYQEPQEPQSTTIDENESDYQEPHWPQSDVIDESVAKNYADQVGGP